MKGLNHDTNYGVSHNLPSVVLVGGNEASPFRSTIIGRSSISGQFQCGFLISPPLSTTPSAGLSSEEKLHGVKYIIESFVGCIRNIVLSSGKAASDLLPITPLVATKHENVHEGCLNKCHQRENLCFIGSKCINHYHQITCDCFGTKYEGEQCDIYSEFISANN